MKDLFKQMLHNKGLYERYDAYLQHTTVDEAIASVIDDFTDEDDVEACVEVVEKILSREDRIKAIEDGGLGAHMVVPLWLSGVMDGSASIWLTYTKDGIVFDTRRQGMKPYIVQALKKLASIIEDA